ncbi:MAG: glycosyltransferase family 2 protein, partial [Opitutaceae bacterium]
MQVSFIIPLYNCLTLTRAMLASLQATLPAGTSHEIILVDDGSTDGTREWLAMLKGSPFKVLLNERNLGYAASNNRGTGIARGEFLALLNNDLILQPGWLEPMLAAHASLKGRAGLIG